MSGKKESLIKKLEKEMRTYGKRHELERAIDLKRKIAKIRFIFENAKILSESRAKSEELIKKNEETKNTLGNLQKIFNLPTVPHRIEAYDIANIQGKYAVGSMTVFIDCISDKNEYRKFKIKTVKQSNDIAMLKEMLERRVRHKEWKYPDLIIVDGGKAQLNVAMIALQNYKSRIINHENTFPILALTKDSKHKGTKIIHKTNNGYRAINLKKLPQKVKNLILQINAEAHRFAIFYYRSLHRKTVK